MDFFDNYEKVNCLKWIFTCTIEVRMHHRKEVMFAITIDAQARWSAP